MISVELVGGQCDGKVITTHPCVAIFDWNSPIVYVMRPGGPPWKADYDAEATERRRQKLAKS